MKKWRITGTIDWTVEELENENGDENGDDNGDEKEAIEVRNFDHLQRLVNDTPNGETLLLADGRIEVAPNRPLVMRRAIILKAHRAHGFQLFREGAEDESTSRAKQCMIFNKYDAVFFDGLVLSGPDTSSPSYAGLISHGKNCSFHNGIVKGFYSTGLGYGILVHRGSRSFLAYANSFLRNRHGISTVGSDTIQIHNTKIINNRFIGNEDDACDNHLGARGTEIRVNYIEPGPLTQDNKVGIRQQATEDFVIQDNVINNRSDVYTVGISVQFIPKGEEQRINGLIAGNRVEGSVTDGIQIDGRAIQEIADLPVEVTFENNFVETFRNSSLFYKRNSPMEQYRDRRNQVANGTLKAPPTEFVPK